MALGGGMGRTQIRLDTDELRIRGILNGPWQPTQFRSDEPVPDEMVGALIWALAEFAGEHKEHRSAFDEAKHPRNPKGTPGGGRFKSIAARVLDALEQHHAGKGDGDPLKEFNREQLRRAAKARGIELKRGASEAQIKKALIEHARPGKVKTEPSHRSRGEDLIAKDAAGLADRTVKTSHNYRSADPGLSAIAHEQGFDGKPRVAAKVEVDKLVAGGALEVFRGVGSGFEHDPKFPNDDPKAVRRVTAAQVNEQLRTGDAYFGVGIYGNGYYFTSDANVATSDYSDGSPGSVVRAVLPKNARIVDTHTLQAEQAKYHMEETGRPGSNAYKTYGDLGRYAAARGYDAMRHEVGSTNPPTYNYIILNRSALVVQEG